MGLVAAFGDGDGLNYFCTDTQLGRCLTEMADDVSE